MDAERTHGFIHDPLDIKILILYIMKRLPRPTDRETLAALSMCDDGVGYFDFSECAADLVKTGHLELKDGLYSITEKGRRNCEITESDLPYPVRIRADRAVSAESARQNRAQLIRASHSVRPRGGCTVALSMSDGVNELMKLELFAADDGQAKKIEEAFKKNAETLYADIMEKLTEE